MTCRRTLFLLLSLLCQTSGPLPAQDDFEDPPIEYSRSTPGNAVSRLQQRLQNQQSQLTWDPEFGYLKSVLHELQIPVQSQSLVFSKTSLQLRRISPRTPRALYFNDDVYLGFCQQGDVLELSAVDPLLGTVFYTLSQQDSGPAPAFVRNTDNCLVCHSSSRTDGVPGHLARSLLTDRSGQPLLAAGSRNVNHTTPVPDRWGGWYVTGTHGNQKHLGNLIVTEAEANGPLDNTKGLNRTSLTDLFPTSRYLTGHSDIVALMILEHQILVHNRITRASFAVREALHYETTMNAALQNPAGTRLESTTRRISSAADKLVEALLLCDEAPLTATMTGTSGFAEHFAATGPRDSQGRSLRDLDMQTRMFRYPCSYLILSPAFQALHPEMKSAVLTRLQNVLTEPTPAPRYSHLSVTDRQNIREILSELLPEFAATMR
ncbi:MAG: hypothetical protein ACK5AN_15925 [Planctomyces sp.]